MLEALSNAGGLKFSRTKLRLQSALDDKFLQTTCTGLWE
jgi:hypothetical protein